MMSKYIFESVNDSWTICSHLTPDGSQMVADNIICTNSVSFFSKFSGNLLGYTDFGDNFCARRFC